MIDQRIRAAIAVILCLNIAAGCQQYGVVSPQAYEIATALYSICNRQDEPRLTKIEMLISQDTKTSAISASERAWLMAIVGKAKTGEWNDAMQDARTMLSEQAH